MLFKASGPGPEAENGSAAGPTAEGVARTTPGRGTTGKTRELKDLDEEVHELVGGVAEDVVVGDGAGRSSLGRSGLPGAEVRHAVLPQRMTRAPQNAPAPYSGSSRARRRSISLSGTAH